MDEVSASRLENTRKIGARLQSEILQRLAEVTQTRAAECMGVSASTISRAKEDLEMICQLVAALGLQFAPADSVVMGQDDIRALERMAFQYLKTRVESGL